MDEANQTQDEQETTTTTTTEAPDAPDKPKATRKPSAKPKAGEGSGPANDHVLGEGADAEFDPLAHGQQEALQNAKADAANQPG